jgi:hypothetical protein
MISLLQHAQLHSTAFITSNLNTLSASPFDWTLRFIQTPPYLTFTSRWALWVGSSTPPVGAAVAEQQLFLILPPKSQVPTPDSQETRLRRFDPRRDGLACPKSSLKFWWLVQWSNWFIGPDSRTPKFPNADQIRLMVTGERGSAPPTAPFEFQHCIAAEAPLGHTSIYS